MSNTNKWVGFLDRSYEQIKKSVIARLKVNTPEVTDLSENNPLIILVSIFSGMLEMLHVYIDRMARESFLPTAKRFSSVVNIVSIIGYRIKSPIPASVDITFTMLDSGDLPVTISTPHTIPAGTPVTTTNGVVFTLTSDLVIPAGESSGVGSCIQGELVSDEPLGSTDGSSSQIFELPPDYADGTCSISINSEVWEEKESLSLSGAFDKHFMVRVNSSGTPSIVFGDGVYGDIPYQSFTVYATYYKTLGAAGNKVLPETITDSGSVPVPAGVNSISCTNLYSPSGGSDAESVDHIRANAPRVSASQDRAISRLDYERLAMLVPGVGSAKAKHCCGPKVLLYIIPEAGGISSKYLLNKVADYMHEKKAITTCITPLAAGVTQIQLSIAVKAKYGQDTSIVEADIKSLLESWGSFPYMGINAKIYFSAIYEQIASLNSVENADITVMYAHPYAFPKGTAPALDWDSEVLVDCTEKAKFRIKYAGATYNVIRNGYSLGSASVGSWFTSPLGDIKVRVNSSALYTLNDEWEFTVYPYNKNLVLDDFTVPMIIEDNISLDITKSLDADNCQSDC